MSAAMLMFFPVLVGYLVVCVCVLFYRMVAEVWN